MLCAFLWWRRAHQLTFGEKCESMKGCKNDGSLTKALSCKVTFIYSARKNVHSDEYKQVHPKNDINPKYQRNNKRAIIQQWYFQQTGIHNIQRRFAWGTAVALLYLFGKQATVCESGLPFYRPDFCPFFGITHQQVSI